MNLKGLTKSQLRSMVKDIDISTLEMCVCGKKSPKKLTEEDIAKFPRSNVP